MDNILYNNLDELVKDDKYHKLLNDPFLHRRIQQLNINDDEAMFFQCSDDQVEQMIETIPDFVRDGIDDDELFHAVKVLMFQYADLYARINTIWCQLINNVNLIDQINDKIYDDEEVRPGFEFVDDLHSRIVNRLADDLNDLWNMNGMFKRRLQDQFNVFLSQFVTKRTYQIKQILKYSQVYVDTSEEQPDQKNQREAYSVDYLIDQYQQDLGKDWNKSERQLDYHDFDREAESLQIANKWTKLIKDCFNPKNRPSHEYVAVLHYRLYKRTLLYLSMLS